MWRLNYSSYYFLFDVFQCILVGDSKGELTVYQLRSMPEPPANQVCLSLYIVWHNTVLTKGISKNSIQYPWAHTTSQSCFMLKRAFTGIFNRISFYLNFTWNYSKWSFYEAFIANLLKSSHESSWHAIYALFMLIKTLRKFLSNCSCGCVEKIPSKPHLIDWYNIYDSTSE